MQLDVTGHHVDVTAALKEYVEQKFAKLERHFDHINHVHVILSVDKSQQIAEAKMNLPGTEVFASCEHKNLYAAIDLLIDKLDRQVLKHKDKLKRH